MFLKSVKLIGIIMGLHRFSFDQIIHLKYKNHFLLIFIIKVNAINTRYNTLCKLDKIELKVLYVPKSLIYIIIYHM